MEKLEILKNYFGHDSFRQGQEEIIDAITEGRDVLGIMPTGSGKSVCYQVPAMLLDGIALIISPLISLMRDQVAGLVQAGIPAAFLNSSLTAAQYRKALERARAGCYKIIYVAPERLLTESFTEFALSSKISLVTVDEAHCVSQWGQDFRPSYLNIAKFVKMLPQRPVTAAFTATATRTVKQDIAALLGLERPFSVNTGYNRENLYFAVKRPNNKFAELKKIIDAHGNKNGIIYCISRNAVDKLCERLSALGYGVTRYHAGLTDKERQENQDDFIYDRKNIIIATNAFGMGIDKSDVRYVVHYNMPKDIESYYQEAGRAGRDGEKAECILLFGAQDIVINKLLIEKGMSAAETDKETRALLIKRAFKRLEAMVGYCKGKKCLRRYILNYFGEALKDNCGNCSYCGGSCKKKEITAEAVKIIECIRDLGERYGQTAVKEALKGSKTERVKKTGANRLKSFGCFKNLKIGKIEELLECLFDNEIIYTTGDMYPIVKLNESAGDILNGTKKVFMEVDDEEESESKPTEAEKSDLSKKALEKKCNEEDTAAYGYEEELFERLRALRKKEAEKAGLPPYIVFGDRSLLDMCRRLPVTDEEFLTVSGVGKEKLGRYGEKFCAIIKEYLDEKPEIKRQRAIERANPLIAIKNIRSFTVSEEPVTMTELLDSLFLQAGLSQSINKTRSIAYDILEKKGAVVWSVGEDGKRFRDITPAAEKYGVIMADKFSKNGVRYKNIYFTPKGQRFMAAALGDKGQEYDIEYEE